MLNRIFLPKVANTVVIIFFFSCMGIVLLSGADAPAAIPSQERAALIALYTSTDGDNWNDKSGWKGNNDEPDGFSQVGSEGSWYGITVSGDHVTEIDLSWNKLKGPIPPEIGNLSSLTILYLYGNKLSGTIPTELGNLSSLTHLNISSNQLYPN